MKIHETLIEPIHTEFTVCKETDIKYKVITKGVDALKLEKPNLVGEPGLDMIIKSRPTENLRAGS